MFECVSFRPKNRSSESGFTWVVVSHVQRLKPEVDVKAVFIDQGKAAKKAGTEGRVYLITKVPGGIDLSPVSVEDAKLCLKILERKGFKTTWSLWVCCFLNETKIINQREFFFKT